MSTVVTFSGVWDSVLFVVSSLSLIVPVLLAVALLTLLERKVLSYMQFRKGPNLVGPLGMLQPMADGLKLFMKENFKPSSASPLLFYLSPFIFFLVALLLWGVAPLHEGVLNVNLSLLFMMALSSLSVYAVLSAGWSSNSKYALLGSVRGVAQMVSYEVCLGLILLPVVIMVGGWGLGSFVAFQSLKIWALFPCFPLFVMWFVSTLAETNRSPFDLAEGESELVSGYNVEYSGAPFALFFIGEYAKMMFMKLVSVILFLGGSSPFSSVYFCSFVVSFKTVFLVVVFLWIRGSFPRVRYDQLMMLMWKGFLPLSLGLLVFYFFFVMASGSLPSYF